MKFAFQIAIDKLKQMKITTINHHRSINCDEDVIEIHSLQIVLIKNSPIHAVLCTP